MIGTEPTTHGLVRLAKSHCESSKSESIKKHLLNSLYKKSLENNSLRQVTANQSESFDYKKARDTTHHNVHTSIVQFTITRLVKTRPTMELHLPV